MGSASPRRVKLLEETGAQFIQMIPEIDENSLGDQKPYEFAERLACCKAEYLIPSLNTNQCLISSDTIVVLKGKILGKPSSNKDAFEILRSLSGHEHVVCTAISLGLCSGVLKSGYELTKVFFNSVTDEEILSYISTGEPMDKAGAYGIQGMGAFLVDRIEGNLDNVIGLPRKLLEKYAAELLETTNKD